MSTGIHYKRLDSSRREIRLIEIQSARDISAPIECRLVNVRLNDDLDFIALSSLFGDSSETDKILVNGQTITITAHLSLALRTSARYSSQPSPSVSSERLFGDPTPARAG
ncbi:hypothetical protein CGCF415_v005959 [Colletotrichum fructicola]|nr:uncharacterized protein CGMCC3_g17362 [Colletotrichum fructicola]KAE9566485.1 hypothetical protein CGMCC3_g17362 [Colletotrichum fructicola]KAF4909433.1 hypothetical protein CGCF415_v005959 [Colletotrichum fructicola]KAF4940153.1 hypothetical protein CGCF245_v003043 [Colletotrichum fructicola]